MKIVLTESQIQKLNEAGFMNDLTKFRFGDAVKGVQGIYKGYGYEYFSFANKLRKVLGKTRRPDIKDIDKLTAIAREARESKMPPYRKTHLIRSINTIIQNITLFNNDIDRIIEQLTNMLNGKNEEE